MRVLLDECVPRQLRTTLAPHEVRTTRELGWDGFKNGALLRRAGEVFDVLLTVDKDFAGPPTSTGSQLSLIILAIGTTDPDRLRPWMPNVLEALAIIKPGEVVFVGGSRRSSDFCLDRV